MSSHHAKLEVSRSSPLLEPRVFQWQKAFHSRTVMCTLLLYVLDYINELVK